MSSPPGWFGWRGEELLLHVRVQPRASRDEIVGPHGDSLKVRITAPPVDGKANSHLIRFLAKEFGVARRDIRLASGETGRDKHLVIAAPVRLPPQAGIIRN